MKLSERMKHWSALTVHRVAEIETELLSMEERLTALEPKKVEKPEVKPAPSDENLPEPISFSHSNPLDGTSLKS